VESTVSAYDAVLLLGFGGPEGQEDVIPFLRNVTRGRGIPEARLEAVATHYRARGGISPVNEQNRALRAALEVELAARSVDLPVYWGNRNWTPYLGDAVAEAAAAGHTRLLALTTSAYSSYSSCRQYRENLVEAVEDPALDGRVSIDAVRPYFDHPGFVTPFIDGLRAALVDLAVRNVATADTHILFTTHSIPSADAAASGPRDVDWGPGGAYEAQHRAVAAVIMAAMPAGQCPDWSLAFQSRSGPVGMPWLEPDVNDAITALASRGGKAVVLVPLGFISDHMEVNWDLDTEAAATAAALGLTFLRTPTPGLHPAFVSGLVDLLLERASNDDVRVRPALTTLGPWRDACSPGCCEKAAAR
jgi:ferrochelatase